VFVALHVLHAGRGLPWLRKSELLSDDEIVRLAACSSRWA